MWQAIQNQSSHIRKELMNMEWARLRTFSCFPFTMDVSVIRLARAGFFLSGSNCVTCYSCEVTRSSWDNNEDPDIYHQRVSPACSSLTGLDSTNIPISRPPDVSAPEVKEVSEESRGTTASSDNPQESTKCSDDVVRGSNHTASRFDNAVKESNHTASRFDDLVRESNHTASRSDDAVREPNHTPSRSDDAPRERIDELNEATNGLEIGKQKHEPSELRQECKNSDNKALETVDTLGVNLSKPKYPAYAVLRVREASYETWPKHLSQSREEMAEAGFVYSGHADFTRCFFCGGGLKNWMSGDDPWIEHARWFPRCMFLLQNKGADFVRSTKQSSPASPERCSSDARGGTAKQKSQVPADMWTYAAVQSLLDMGYDRAIIERATCNVINNKSLQDVEAVELLDEMFRIQEAVNSDYVSDPTSRRQPVTSETSSYSEDKETRRLMQENQELREMSVCKVCCDAEVAIVFLPCGHFVCCSECAPAMIKCPACKVVIQASVRAWLV